LGACCARPAPRREPRTQEQTIGGGTKGFSYVEKRISRTHSVILATYNWPEALTAVLHGLSSQTDRNFEVVIADDGSDEPTTDVIGTARDRLPIRHVWHEHRGFRLAEIRNRAILASKGAYCIFLDGDCIPRPSFVAAHRQLAEPGWYVQGNRVSLRKEFTGRVLAEQLTPGDWSLPRWWVHRWRRHVSRTAPLITLPLGPLRKRTAQTGEKALGCNQAMWRSDLDRIDGFDAAYVGWGWEDSDVAQRLLHAGVGRKSGRYATAVIHLWHEPHYSRENRLLFETVLADNRVAARRGISALKSENDERTVEPAE